MQSLSRITTASHGVAETPEKHSNFANASYLHFYKQSYLNSPTLLNHLIHILPRIANLAHILRSTFSIALRLATTRTITPKMLGALSLSA